MRGLIKRFDEPGRTIGETIKRIRGCPPRGKTMTHGPNFQNLSDHQKDPRASAQKSESHMCVTPGDFRPTDGSGIHPDARGANSLLPARSRAARGREGQGRGAPRPRGAHRSGGAAEAARPAPLGSITGGGRGDLGDLGGG